MVPAGPKLPVPAGPAAVEIGQPAIRIRQQRREIDLMAIRQGEIAAERVKTDRFQHSAALVTDHHFAVGNLEAIVAE